MVRGRERKEFEILKELIKDAIPDTWYFIGAYSDDSVCLVEVDGKFEVCTFERGRKEDLSVHTNIKEAVNVFLRELCSDKAQAQKIGEEFAKRIVE